MVVIKCGTGMKVYKQVWSGVFWGQLFHNLVFLKPLILAPHFFRPYLGSKLAPNLGPCCQLFGTFLGVLLAYQLEIALNTIFLLIFDRFSILRIPKNTAPADDFEDICICFMIALETDLGPILVRFWNPKSLQNRSQEGPEGC